MRIRLRAVSRPMPSAEPVTNTLVIRTSSRAVGSRSRSAASPSSAAQAPLHAGNDRALGEIVEAEVLASAALGEVQTGVETEAAEESVPAEHAGAGELGPGGVPRRVDDKRPDVLVADLLGDALCLDQRLLAEERDVSPTVGDEDDEGVDVGKAIAARKRIVPDACNAVGDREVGK